MKKSNSPGQILIVLILALSIISIFLVIISNNVRQDSIEQIQSEQYEKYYSVVEEKLLEVVTNQSSSCDLDVTNPCVISDVVSDPNSNLNVNELTIGVTELNTFNNVGIQKDKNFTIDLSGYSDTLTMAWNGEAALVVNIDYQMSGTKEYKTVKSVYDQVGIFPGSASFPSTNCIDFNVINNSSFSFSVDQCLSTLETSGTYDTVAIRIKPIMLQGDAIDLSLTGVAAGFPPQIREYTAQAELNDDLINSPTIVLEVAVPFLNPTIEIADYALRTEDTIVKSY